MTARERPLPPPPPRLYRCPLCCREVFEAVYTTVTGQIVGCDRCLTERPVELVMKGEPL